MKQRQILIRAWDEDNKVMLPAIDLSQSAEYHPWKIGEKDLPLMEYIGVRDKNGEAIYDGSIVTIDDSYTEYVTDYGGPEIDFCHIGVVKDNGLGAFVIEIQNLKYAESGQFEPGTTYTFMDIKDEVGLEAIKVIGDIFSDPDLLEKPAA